MIISQFIRKNNPSYFHFVKYKNNKSNGTSKNKDNYFAQFYMRSKENYGFTLEFIL